MNDLISRQDIEWHHYLVADGNGMYHDEKVAYKSQIDDLPSAQPEIIRCKDCKYKNVYRFPPKYDERDYCEKHGKVVDVADFCSWAERRTDEP